MRLKLTSIPAPGSISYIGREGFPGFLWAVFDKHEEVRTGILRPLATFERVEEADRYMNEQECSDDPR